MCFLRIEEVFLTKTGGPEVIKEKINIFDKKIRGLKKRGRGFKKKRWKKFIS